ncbi:VOC family protein [Trebonia kvetii]|nr:VOC family protein [Trebonia kvetii]
MKSSHQHEGNEAPHYDLAWGDFTSGEYVMLRIAPAGPGQRTTGAQIGTTVDDVDAVHQKADQFGVTVLEQPHDGEWGRNAVYEDPDRNIVSVTSAN